MYTLWLVVVGSFCAIIATVIDKYNEQKEKEKSAKQALIDKNNALIAEQKRSQEYKELLRKTIEISIDQRTMLDSSTKIIDLQKKLSETNIKLQSLQHETINKLLGSNKVVLKIRVLQSSIGEFTAVWELENEDDLPIRSMKILIDDFSSTITKVYALREDGGAAHVDTKPGSNRYITQDVGDIAGKGKRNLYDSVFPISINLIPYRITLQWLTGDLDIFFSLKKKKEKYIIDGLKCGEQYDICDVTVLFKNSKVQYDKFLKYTFTKNDYIYGKVYPYKP